MSEPVNPYDIEDDGGCTCGAYYDGECGCGLYVDSAYKRVWQEGFDAAKALLPEVAEIAEQVLWPIRNLAMEHMDCSGCPTPWWLKQALARDSEGPRHDPR